MRLLQIRDEAWAASGEAHARIQRERDIYHNLEYPEDERILRTKVPRSQRSLDPQITKGVNRLVSPYISQLASMEIEADRSEVQEADKPFIGDLQNWYEMMEAADNETETRKTLVEHNLVGGMAIAKTYYDPRTEIFRSESVSPLMIAVDGGASRIDLSDAMVVCQQYWYPEYYLKLHYDWEPAKGTVKDVVRKYFRYNEPTHRLDEMWIRRELLEACEDVDKDALALDKKQMFRVIFIDDEVVEIKHTPYWWPDFPYSCWRNFSAFYDSKKAQDFWGYGFPTYLIEPQKFLDEMLAAIVEAARHIPVGQAVAQKGALDPEQDYGVDSQLIELQEGYNIKEAFQKLPLDQFPQIFGDLVVDARNSMQEMMPSLTPVFTGEEPSGNSSGKAIQSKQWAAHSQIEDNLSRGNVMMRHRAIQRLTGIQQTAKKPLLPHVFRGQLDLPDYFPEDARHVGFNVTYADTAAMPSSPQGRMELVQWLASLGYMLSPEDVLKLTKLDTAVGLSPDMFQQMMQVAPSQALMGNQTLSGVQAPMP